VDFGIAGKVRCIGSHFPTLEQLLVLAHIFIALSVKRLVSFDNLKLVRACQIGIGLFGSKFD